MTFQPAIIGFVTVWNVQSHLVHQPAISTTATSDDQPSSRYGCHNVVVTMAALLTEASYNLYYAVVLCDMNLHGSKGPILIATVTEAVKYYLTGQYTTTHVAGKLVQRVILTCRQSCFTMTFKWAIVGFDATRNIQSHSSHQTAGKKRDRRSRRSTMLPELLANTDQRVRTYNT